jgi:hypothetical protein
MAIAARRERAIGVARRGLSLRTRAVSVTFVGTAYEAITAARAHARPTRAMVVGRTISVLRARATTAAFAEPRLAVRPCRAHLIERTRDAITPAVHIGLAAVELTIHTMERNAASLLAGGPI